MITFRKGDAVEALKNGSIDVLAHGCNCVGGFGSGIAGQIAKEFPYAKERYLYYVDCCDSDNRFDLLGHVQPVTVINYEHGINKAERFIANCFTQYHYYPRDRCHADYKAIKNCMEELKRFFIYSEKIGLPRIGAGLAGGDWDIIVKIIDEAFKDREVFVYEL